MGINLDGVVFGAQALLGPMRARGGGAMVATASLAGLAAVPMDPIYAANKHAVVGLTRSLGPVLALDGIRFNAVCPGFSESNIVAPIRDALAEQGLDLIAAEIGRRHRRAHPAQRRCRRVLVRPAAARARPLPLPQRAGAGAHRSRPLGAKGRLTRASGGNQNGQWAASPSRSWPGWPASP